MAQQAKAFGAKPDEQKSSPEIHIVEEENQLPEVFLWPPHVACGTVIHTHKTSKCIQTHSSTAVGTQPIAMHGVMCLFHATSCICATEYEKKRTSTLPQYLA